MSSPASEQLSRLGHGSQVRGRVSGGPGTLEVHGALSGEVDWSGRLVIGSRARLEAGGRAEVLEVLGTLHGGFEVAREVIVGQGARWSGGCAAPSMATEAGAWLEGEFRIRPVEAAER